MIRKVIRNLLFSMLLSSIFVIMGVLLAIFISKQYSYKLEDTLAIEGLILLVIGVLSMMEGGISFTSIRSVPQTDSPPDTYTDVETLANERQKDATNHFSSSSIIKLTFSGVTLIFAGIFIFLCSNFIDKLF